MKLTRRRLLHGGALAATGALLPRAAALATQEAPARLRILVPAYFYPAGEGRAAWERMAAAGARVPIVAIVNPATGPGERADPNYRDVIDRSLEGGLTLLGYVNTDYGNRPEAAVHADLERWPALYPGLGGYFFDLQPSGGEAVAQYAGLRAAARGRIPDALVVTNPGTVCVEEYVSRSAAEVVCLYENREGFDAYRSPRWVRRYDPQRLACLPYAIPDLPGMRTALRHAVDQGFGTVYVTDRDGANPWDGLPSYWETLVDAVRAHNEAAARVASE